MKKLSINQINARIQSNETIYMYRLLSSPEYYYNSRNWRYNYYNFNYFHGQTVRLEQKGTFLCQACHKYLADYAGAKLHDSLYKLGSTAFTCPVSGYVTEFRYSCTLDYYGVRTSLSVYHNARETHLLTNAPVKSSKTWAAFDINEYFNIVLLPKYLHPVGLFRNIQLMNKCTKKEALTIYKNYYLPKVKPLTDDARHDYKMKGYARLLNKRKNLTVPAYNDLNLNQLIRAYLHAPTFKRKTVMQPTPNPFEMYDYLTIQYDTEEEIMQEAETLLMQPANVYYV